jgi:transposase-like protein
MLGSRMHYGDGSWSAGRRVFESGRPIARIARDLGVPAQTLRTYVRRVEANEAGHLDDAGGSLV